MEYKGTLQNKMKNSDSLRQKELAKLIRNMASQQTDDIKEQIKDI